jgi:5-carboxymethyl-2-hydroxymuconate isomerase
MPHCILELSDTVVDRPDLRRVLVDVHEALLATGLFSSADVKGRAVRHEIAAVGLGEPDRSFVSLTVRILEGRRPEVKADLAERALAVLERWFPESLAHTRCSLTVEIVDIDRASYRRRRPTEDGAGRADP